MGESIVNIIPYLIGHHESESVVQREVREERHCVVQRAEHLCIIKQEGGGVSTGGSSG